MTTYTCPDCDGPVLPPDRLGLRFHHDVNCEIGAAEDATTYRDRWLCGGRATDVGSPNLGDRFTRDATDAERRLLLVIGAPAAVVAATTTEIRFVSHALRSRRFAGISVAGLLGVGGVWQA